MSLGAAAAVCCEDEDEDEALAAAVRARFFGGIVGCRLVLFNTRMVDALYLYGGR